jgi:hypothetical protein
VSLNRGLGAGWTRPSMVVKDSCAVCKGWWVISSSSRTGVTQASTSAKRSVHSALVRAAMADDGHSGPVRAVIGESSGNAEVDDAAY